MKPTHASNPILAPRLLCPAHSQDVSFLLPGLTVMCTLFFFNHLNGFSRARRYENRTAWSHVAGVRAPQHAARPPTPFS